MIATLLDLAPLEIAGCFQACFSALAVHRYPA